ncbi:DNA phosphorothioation-dependent restriction protein DptF [Bacillus fengqiuensis]|nr:DNA phosphorothioation-dependent restriction protein DptF [Bacillus fengqiuensis]
MLTVHNCLIDKLKVLKESAQEAVENLDKFSEFKEYMHVEREIERDLISLLQSINNSEKSHLILLCGSVGDGKSHLLSKLKNKNPELMGSFALHNDATESFKPDGTSLETLNEVLEPFSDDFLEVSNKKMILAINLGVLNNFISSPFAIERYSKLASYVQGSDVFEVSKPTNKWLDTDQFHILSFSDYHLFELGEKGPASPYIESIISKLVSKDTDNPFYQAYQDTCLQTCSFKEKCPVKKNYELLMNSEDQKGITSLLIEAIVKEKLIISTRSLINFFYEIMVSPVFDSSTADEIKKLFSKDSFSALYVRSLMPMLLFGHKDRSFVLKALQQIDPIHKRNQQMDSLLTALYTSLQPLNIIENYIEETQESLSQFQLALEKEELEIYELFKYVVRSLRLKPNGVSLKLEDHIYESYMKYLYHFNTGSRMPLKTIYQDIEKAIRNWYGSIDSDSVYLKAENDQFIMGQRLELGFEVSHVVPNPDGRNYFTTNIELRYKKKSGDVESVSLFLDFSLYRLLMKVKDGYRPNKGDISNAIHFSDFYERLMEFGDKQKQLKIINKYKEVFRLEYDESFDTYIFERVEA